MQGFKVAIIGKPNVGKSSLLNKLLSYDRAIISDIAGTTRDTIEEQLRIGTHLVTIVDTAGIRESGDLIEKIGIERSLQAMAESEIVIAMFDNSRAIDAEDEAIFGLLNTPEANKPILKVLNKSDLNNAFDRTSLGDAYLPLSCHHDAQILIEALQSLLDATTRDDTMMLTSLRQLDAVKKAYDAIEEGSHFLTQGELELFAFHINEAILAISSITTAFERDEILESMFSHFCVGK